MKLICLERRDNHDRPVVELVDLDTGLLYRSTFDGDLARHDFTHVVTIEPLSLDATEAVPNTWRGEQADHILATMMSLWRQFGVDHDYVKAEAIKQSHAATAAPKHIKEGSTP